MKNTEFESVIQVSVAGPMTYVGEIVDMKPGVYVTVRYKQPRRPKPSVKQIMWSDVILVTGAIGEVGSVVAKAGSVSILSGKGGFDNVNEKFATAIVNDMQITVNPYNANVESFIDKDDAEAPVGRKAKAKGAKPAKGKVAKKKKRK